MRRCRREAEVESNPPKSPFKKGDFKAFFNFPKRRPEVPPFRKGGSGGIRVSKINCTASPTRRSKSSTRNLPCRGRSMKRCKCEAEVGSNPPKSPFKQGGLYNISFSRKSEPKIPPFGQRGVRGDSEDQSNPAAVRPHPRRGQNRRPAVYHVRGRV